MAKEVTRRVTIWQEREGERRELEDTVVVEAPLTVFFNDREVVTLLCTPRHLDELAVGFLLSEGFLKERTRLEKVEVDGEEGRAVIRYRGDSPVARETFLKRVITTGCGRGTSFYHLTDAFIRPVSETGVMVDGATILRLMREAQKASELFLTTGGVHSAFLANEKEIILLREDIGRHNALDKIIGHCFLHGIATADKMLLTTGRLTSEIILKAARQGIPIVISRSAPTAMAVELGERLGITLIGFVRGSRFNLYTHPYRVEGGQR